MAKRGRKRKHKIKIKADTAKSVLSVCLLFAGGLVLISFIAPGYTVNSTIQNVIRGFFGFPSILLAPILIIWGLLFLQSVKIKYVEPRVLFGLVGLLISLSGILHIFVNSDTAYEKASQGMGGGMVGYKIASILTSMISKYGAFLFLLTVLLITFLFVIDIPLDELLLKVKNKLAVLKDVKPLGKFKKSQNIEDSNVEIGEGTEFAAGHSIETEQKEHLNEIDKPVFEVIPTMAEPQKGLDIKVPASDGEVVSLAPGLPYTNKVWEYPPLDLLSNPANEQAERGNVNSRTDVIKQTLKDFGINVEMGSPNFGPTVTQYTLQASSGTKVAKIASLQNDLALALASPTGTVRVEAPIPGTSSIGVEVPNNKPETVYFKELFTSDKMKAESAKSKLAIVLGKDVGGNPIVYDIKKMPHLLVAGATGSGKSVFLHNLMFSLLYKAGPTEVKFILVDPKRVELVYYNDIPHLYTPVITDLDKAPSVFKWAADEMKRRYELLETAKVRDIDSYNEKSGFQAMPYIVIVVDELAEIMITDANSIEKSIIRIAQLARAVGIHLILTTQRPSTNIITGIIKANIPCRVAFNVTSNIDSRVIIDQPGAEKLIGKGDMLFVPPDASKPKRIQGAFISEREIISLVNYLKTAGVEPDYKEEIFEVSKSADLSISAGGESTDDYFSEAVDVVVTAGKASASLLQRRLSIGYARAARILDELEAKGIIGPAQGSKAREVYVNYDADEELSPLTSISEEND